MNMLIKVLYTIVISMVIIYVVTAIFQFFSISIATYGIYLMFLIALALLNAFLPSKVGKLFEPK